MKIKSGFMLRQIAGSWIVVPLGARVVEFNGLISLSETSAIIWEMIEASASREEIIHRIISEYDIDRETVEKDYDAFINEAVEKGLIEL